MPWNWDFLGKKKAAAAVELKAPLLKAATEDKSAQSGVQQAFIQFAVINSVLTKAADLKPENLQKISELSDQLQKAITLYESDSQNKDTARDMFNTEISKLKASVIKVVGVLNSHEGAVTEEGEYEHPYQSEIDSWQQVLGNIEKLSQTSSKPAGPR